MIVYTIDMDTISEIIKKARKQQGLSLRKFGKALGVSYQTVKNWEGGETIPDFYHIYYLRDVSGGWLREMATSILNILLNEKENA